MGINMSRISKQKIMQELIDIPEKIVTERTPKKSIFGFGRQKTVTKGSEGKAIRTADLAFALKLSSLHIKLLKNPQEVSEAKQTLARVAKSLKESESKAVNPQKGPSYKQKARMKLYDKIIKKGEVERIKTESLSLPLAKIEFEILEKTEKNNPEIKKFEVMRSKLHSSDPIVYAKHHSVITLIRDSIDQTTFNDQRLKILRAHLQKINKAKSTDELPEIIESFGKEISQLPQFSLSWDTLKDYVSKDKSKMKWLDETTPDGKILVRPVNEQDFNDFLADANKAMKI